MCYNCGCEIPDDNMGDVNNITNSTFHHMAEHMGKKDEDVKRMVYDMLKNNQPIEDEHLKEMFEKAAKASVQSIDEAKQNTLHLLKQQFGG